MIELTEPQIWVLIGIFGAVIFSEMNGRFDTTNAKIDGLDRDVQVLTQRVFGTD